MKAILNLKTIKQLPPPVLTSAIYLICSILHKGVAFFAVPLYTRLATSEEYGIYALYQSWDSVLIIFASLNMWNYLFNNGMIKYKGKEDEFTSALIGLNLLLTTCLLVIFIFISDWFVSTSGLPLAVVILMFADFYLRPSYEYWCSRQRFEYNVIKYAITAIIIAIFTPLLSVLFIYLSDMLSYGAGTGLVAGKVICSGVFYVAVMIYLLRRCHYLYNKEIWHFALGYNLPLIPHFLSSIILSQSDRIMIGYLCGTSEAGIYSVAYSIAAVMLILNAAIMDSIIPWTYKSLEKKEYGKFPIISQTATMIIICINIIVAITAPEIIAIMAPEEYSSATYIIPPVAISNVFIFMYNFYANVEYFYEKTKLIAVASVTSAIMNILLNYIFISKYGFIAAGYTTLFCYILYSLCHFFLMKRVMNEHNIQHIYNNGLLWAIALVASCVAVSCVFIYDTLYIRYALLLLCFLAVILLRRRIYNQITIILQLKKK